MSTLIISFVATAVSCFLVVRPNIVTRTFPFVVIAGVVSNGLALVSNGGLMPVRGYAYLNDGYHTIVTDHTNFIWLTDQIEVWRLTVSIGDVLIYAGLSLYVCGILFWLWRCMTVQSQPQQGA